MDADERPAATCPGCGRPVAECQAEDVDESFPAQTRSKSGERLDDFRERPTMQTPSSDAATCSRCGHEKAERGNDVLPFAPCQHLEGRPATARLFPFAYATESCWCSNYEEAENHV